MLKAQLYQMSAQYELDQQAEALKCGPQSDRLTRDYPTMASARGDLEGELLWKLRELMFQPKLWGALRQHKLTNRIRATAFQMLMRLGAKVRRHIYINALRLAASNPHKGFRNLFVLVVPLYSPPSHYGFHARSLKLRKIVIM